MNKFILQILFTIFLAVFLTCTTASYLPEGNSEIYGTIIDVQTGEPLAGVSVQIPGRGMRAASDSGGIYTIRGIPEGKYSLLFVFSGYRTVELNGIVVGEGEHCKVDVDLAPESLQSSRQAQSGEIENSGKTHHSEGRYMSNRGEKRRTESSARDDEASSGPADRRESKPGIEDNDALHETLPGARRAIQPLRAAAHNDNEEYPYFLGYLKRFSDLDGVYHRNFDDRYFIKFSDGNGKPIINLPFEITDRDGKVLWKAHSYSNGENVLFPNLMCPEAAEDKLFVRANNAGHPVSHELNRLQDRITHLTVLQHPAASELSLDLLFILDATGSMEDEIRQLKDHLYAIHTRIRNYFNSLPMRFGLIVYRDRQDDFVVREYDFVDDIARFQQLLDAVYCDGGGDYREDVQAALDVALHKMSWSENGVRLSFLLADAPPHLDYADRFDYLDAALEANRRGIKLYTIGASGLDMSGEYIFRQIAAVTYGEFIFLTYGETGESSGSDVGKVSHHTGDNYTSHNLDDVVVDIVKKEISYQLPPGQLVHRETPPQWQDTYLRIRMDNLWSQMVKQIDEFCPGDSVAVLAPFEYTNKKLDDVSRYLQQLSTLTLLNFHRMKLVERERLEEILKEAGLTMSGIIEAEEYYTLNRLLSSDFVFLGEVSYTGVDRVVFMRAVRTSDGQVVAAARIRI